MIALGRWLFLPSLCLLIGFTVIGSLLSRQWGWSEYASPQLYVVYYQLVEDQFRLFYAANADGSSEGEKLTWQQKALTWLDCSPDGRTLAFLSNENHLYVADQTGLLYDRPLEARTNINLANNGSVTLSGGRVVDATQDYALRRPDSNVYRDVQVSSAGFTLWSNSEDTGVSVISPVAEISSIPDGYAPRWLASEQIFTFNDWGRTTYGRYVADAVTRKRVRLRTLGVFGAFSPDATRIVSSFVDRRTGNYRLIVADTFSDNFVLLTRNPQASYRPRCFLSFRPDMLVEG